MDSAVCKIKGNVQIEDTSIIYARPHLYFNHFHKLSITIRILINNRHSCSVKSVSARSATLKFSCSKMEMTAWSNNIMSCPDNFYIGVIDAERYGNRTKI